MKQNNQGAPIIGTILMLSTLANVITNTLAAPNSETSAKPPVDVNRLVNTKSGPVLEKNVERPLRYRPEGTDFVIAHDGMRREMIRSPNEAGDHGRQGR